MTNKEIRASVLLTKCKELLSDYAELVSTLEKEVKLLNDKLKLQEKQVIIAHKIISHHESKRIIRKMVKGE